jgi:hypothetical protein
VTSAENVEIVRRWLTVVTLKPDEVRDAAADFWDPDGNYYPVRKFPEAEPCHGREEITRFFVRWREIWSSFEHEIKELVAVGDDRVLACWTMQAEGTGSGMKLAGDIYNCIWLRHGRLLRWEDHLTLKGALAALGLSGDTLEAAGLRG